nr:hypothetical protein [Tanacetum cinerariifolium]
MHQPPEESVKEFEKQLKTVVIFALEGVNQPPQETSVEILQARENLMKSIQTFLKKFNRISFRETPKDIHELLHKLLKDFQIISEELAEYINSSSWNYPTFYDDDNEYTIQYREYLENSSKAITPDLPTEEPNNSRRYFDDTCDVPFCDNSPPLDVLNDHFEVFSDFNDDCTSSDDNSFEDIDYVEASPPDSELVSLEEMKNDILLTLSLKSRILLSYSDNYLPEFETFSDHTEETSSGRTTTHVDNSLPEYDSFLFEIEPDQGELTSVVMEDILGEPHVHVPNVLPTNPILMLDSDFIPSDDSFGSDLEVPFPSGTKNKIFDPGIFFEVQSKRFISWDTFSIPFIRNLLCPVIEILISFLSEMKTEFSILDCLDFEDSCTRGFVHRPLEFLSLAYLYMGI